MSDGLASWFGEHTKAGPHGAAVGTQYALACKLDGTPALGGDGNPVNVTRDDLIRRTKLGHDAVVHGRNELLGRPTTLHGGSGRKRAAPGLEVPELEELEAAGGRGKYGLYRIRVYLCPKWKQCWTCADLARKLKRRRPEVRAEYLNPEDGVPPQPKDPQEPEIPSGSPTLSAEPEAEIPSGSPTVPAEKTVGPPGRFSGDGDPGNRRAARPTSSNPRGYLRDDPTEQSDPSDNGAGHPGSVAGGRDHEPPQAARSDATVAASGLQVVGRVAITEGLSTTTDAGGHSTIVALRARSDSQARASPISNGNGIGNGKSRPGTKGGRLIQELDVWDEAPLPVEPLGPLEDELRTVVREVGFDAVLVAA